MNKPQMTILLTLWSDNHDKDEMFGTRPNEPHLILNQQKIKVDADSNLLFVLLRTIRDVLKIDEEPIIIMARNQFASSQGIEEVRLKIAMCEYVCRAVVGL